MLNIKVELINNTPLWVAANAIRTCWQSYDKSDTAVVCSDCGEIKTPDVDHCEECFSNSFEIVCGDKDAELIDRVGNKYKHASTLEHISFSFKISISRAALQELARHRIATLSVKSSRYTLKELKKEKSFSVETLLKDIENVSDTVLEEAQLDVLNRAENYLIMTGNHIVDMYSIKALENLRIAIHSGISNDEAKYCMPESYMTELTLTINARSLKNFISLRSDKAALREMRELSHLIYDKLPDDHKYLFAEDLKSY